MPWTYKRYPTSMKNLNVHDRSRAIGIANALLDKGYSDAQAIVFAQAQIKKSPTKRDPSQRPPRRVGKKSAKSSKRPSRKTSRHSRRETVLGRAR